MNPALSISLLIIVSLMQGIACAGPFLYEDFESYRDGRPWVGPGGQNKRWNQWPKDAPAYNSIATLAYKGHQSLLLNNEGTDAYYIQSHDSALTPEWKEAASSANRTYHRFYFYIPKESSDVTGGLLTFYIEQRNNTPFSTAAMISVFNEAKKGQVVMATDGPGNGAVVWRQTGSWDYDKWISVEIEQDYKTKKYNVTISGEASIRGLNFRMADTWEGETLGEKSQAKFSASPRVKIYLDDILFSTRLPNAEAPTN